MNQYAQCRPYAFFFDANYEHYPFNYGDSIDKVIFAALLEADSDGKEAFRVWEGDLMLHRLADRLTSISTNVSGSRYVSHQYATQIDRSLWTALVWDLCDSAKQGWHSLDVREAAFTFLRRDIHVIALSALHPSTRERLHERLASKLYYIGGMEIDTGNPLHVRVFPGSLIWTNAYRRRSLLFIDRWLDPGELYDLAGGGHWWSDLPFADVQWETEDSPDMPDTVVLTELSARGERSKALLERTGESSHLERVADALFQAARLDRGAAPVTFDIATIPDAPSAVIPPAKLRDYSLNPDHPVGGSKAVLFKDLLDISGKDWRFLGYQLLRSLPTAAVVSKARMSNYGVQYHVDIAVVGLNGAVKPVRAAWIVRANTAPQLVSALLAPPHVPLDSLPPPVNPPFLGVDPQTPDEFVELIQVADREGREAASRAIAVPMFVARDVVERGAFGGAWINIPDARRRFPRWALRSGHAYPGNGSGVSIPAGKYVHVQEAEQYAKAFQLVLWLHGIEATVETYLD